MRLWVHTIWHAVTAAVLQTAGPKENERFENLLHKWGEEKTSYAWFLYCNANPKPYNLEPVKHVDEFMSRNGNKIVREVENTAAITRFPLSAFLAVAEGYLVKAKLEMEAYMAQPKGSRRMDHNLDCWRVQMTEARANKSFNEKW
jgi:hypothetical protein